MKNIKKAIAILMAAVMVLSLCACGRFGAKMAQAAAKMKKVENFAMDADLDVDMTLKAAGTEFPFGMNCALKTESFISPLKNHTVMSMNMAGAEDMEKEFYVQEVEGGRAAVYYTEDDGESWKAEVVDVSEMEKMDIPSISREQLEYISEIGKTFKEGEEETINGSPAVVFNGVVTGENVLDFMKAFGIDEMMSSSTGFDMGKINVEDLDDINVKIAIDKASGLFSQIKVDMTDFLREMMKVTVAGTIVQPEEAEGAMGEAAEPAEDVAEEAAEAVEDAAEAEESEEAEEESVEQIPLPVDVECEISSAILTINLYDYNQVENFEMPS